MLVDADGNPAGTIGCVQDVTARIRMEQRQQDAGARALLLQEVTAEFSQARTPDQVGCRCTRGRGSWSGCGGDDRGGAVTAARESTRRALRRRRQLLDTLATQRAIAAERAELSRDHRDRRGAPVQPGREPAADARQASRSRRFYAPGGDDLEQVGGDWYDAVGTATGGLVLVVGDVMGRGVRAATTMIHVRAGIRGLLTVEPAPAALLEAADQMMARDAPEQFVTAVAVLVDPVSGALELCNAGHVPLVVVHPDGCTATLGLGSGHPARRRARPRGGPPMRATLEPGTLPCWSPTASSSPVTTTSTRGSTGSGDAPPSSATAPGRAGRRARRAGRRACSTTTSPWWRPDSELVSAAHASSTAVGTPATYQSTPATRTCWVAPPTPRRMAAPGSSSYGGTECWQTTCRRPSATAVASIEPDPSIRSVAARPTIRPNAAPTSPP